MASLIADISRDFRSILDRLVDLEMLRDNNQLIEFSSKDETVLSWSRNPSLSYLFGTYSSMEQYKMILDNRDFCFCFDDGGIVQMSYIVNKDEIVWHRLSYYPCPFRFTSEEVSEISLSEISELFSANDLRDRIRLVSPVRFDFDAKVCDEKHAQSHLTINKDTCRLPLYGPISPGHFMRFILRYFYEDEFSSEFHGDWVKPRFYGRTLPHSSMALNPHEFYVDTSITN